jgi:hypothetical protein
MLPRDELVVGNIYYMSKRHNPYNIEEVMVKHSLSRECAIEKINELKNKTSGSVANYIRRYGEEEGLRRFKIFSEKSKHTQDTYKIKYGDNWEEAWTEYKKSKSSGRNALIDKYGELEGLKRFEESNEKRRNSQSKEYLISKLGEDGYKQLIESRQTGSLKSFISKYGVEVGTKRYKETNLKKSESVTLAGFIKRWGEVEGQIKYNDRCIKISPIYQQLKKKYGERIALDIYRRYDDSKQITKDHELKKIKINKNKASRFSKLSKGCVSKESDFFFQKLSDSLNRTLIFGDKKTEFKLFDENKRRLYYYDCFDPETNTLIEFHGVAYHPKVGDVEWISPFGRTYEKALSYDTDKKNLALNLGYNYLVVYSDEVKLKHHLDKKISEILKILDI